MSRFHEERAIRALVERYFTATYEADLPAVKSCFHEQAAMFGFLGPETVMGGPGHFFNDLASRPSMAEEAVDCKYVIRRISVTGNIADAVISVDGFFGAFSVEDHFHLMKLEGEWKIVCKTFTTVD